jgi:hypothetical protein
VRHGSSQYLPRSGFSFRVRRRDMEVWLISYGGA